MNLFEISHILPQHFYASHHKNSKIYTILRLKSKKQLIFLLTQKTFTIFALAFKPRWRNR